MPNTMFMDATVPSANFSGINLAAIYEICTMISSDRYTDGYTKLPILFKYRTYNCYNCESVGKGSGFYINRSRLMCRDNFTICEKCVASTSYAQNIEYNCNGCGRRDSLNNFAIIESKVFINGKSGMAHICHSCSESNRLDSSYIYCNVCDMYHHPEKISDNRYGYCSGCTSKMTKCGDCNAYHFIDKHENSKFIINESGNGVPGGVVLFCKAKVKNTYGLNIMDLVAKDLAKIAAKKTAEAVV